MRRAISGLVSVVVCLSIALLYLKIFYLKAFLVNLEKFNKILVLIIVLG